MTFLGVRNGDVDLSMVVGILDQGEEALFRMTLNLVSFILRLIFSKQFFYDKFPTFLKFS